MKKLIATVGLLFIVPLFSVPWACARDIPMGFDVFGEFGPSCLEGNVHSGASGQVKCEAGRFFGGMRLRLTRHDAVEASYSYSPNVFDEAFPLHYENYLLNSHSINYVRYLSAYPHLQPFVTGGVGWESFHGTAGWNNWLTTNVSQFAWNFGAGIDVIPQRYFALRFEFRDYTTGMPHYNTSSLHNIVPSIGIVLRFNRNRKL
ncbi:MAG: outer membrane beta-barrel protein [Terriglobia bacterium]